MNLPARQLPSRPLPSASVAQPAAVRSPVAASSVGRILAWLLWFARAKPLGAFGGALVVVMMLAAIFADIVVPQDPFAVNPPYRLRPPGFEFLLGSDDLGRDLLSRIIYGARSSMQSGMAVLIGGTLVGAFIGITSAYWGGWYDLVVQRIVDILMAFPMIVLALAIVAMLGQSFWNVVLALSVVLIPGVSRVLRGSTLSVKQHQYVDAARALGASDWRILGVHIFPNVLAPIIVLASVNLSAVILVESTLSFLGLGTPPPMPTWGGMLSGSGRRFMEVAPWIAIFPGIAISLAVLGLNLLGDALRDILDPRLRNR